MSYNLKYFSRYPYFNPSGVQTNDYYELRLLVANYAGDAIEVNPGAKHPVVRQDKNEQIISRTLEFSLETEDDLEFEDLYAENPYSVEVLFLHYKSADDTYSVVYRGWLITEQYEAPYIDPPFDVIFSATDGFGLLKNKLFSMPLTAGRVREIDIIDHCLNDDLPQSASEYIVGLGTSHHSATALESTLVHTYLNVAQFYEDGIGMTRYDVLNDVLRSYGYECFIQRHVNNYTIADISFLSNTVKKPLVLTKNGNNWNAVMASDSFISDIINVDSGTNINAEAIVIDYLNTEVQKRNGLFELTQEYEVNSNMFAYGDILDSQFELYPGSNINYKPKHWFPQGQGSYITVRKSAPAEGRSKPSIQMDYTQGGTYNKIYAISRSVPIVPAPDLPLIIEVGYHGQSKTSKNKFRLGIATGTHRLGKDGWVENQPGENKTCIDLPFTAETNNGLSVYTIKADGFPGGNSLTVEVGSPTDWVTIFLDYVNIKIDPAVFDPPGSLYYNYAVSKYASGKLDSNIIGDPPINLENINLLYRNIKLLSNGNTVWNWKYTSDSETTQNRRLAELWLFNSASNNRVPRKIIYGTFFARSRNLIKDYNPGQNNYNWLIFKPNDFASVHSNFLFLDGEINLLTNEVNGNFIQLLPYVELAMYAGDSIAGGGAGDSQESQTGGQASGMIMPKHTHLQDEVDESEGWISTGLLSKLNISSFNELFEKKTDGNGQSYIQAKHSFVSIGGVTAYGSGADVPSLWDDLPKATASSLGGIKVGTNLTIDSNGVLHAQAGGVSSWNDLTDKPTSFPPSTHTHAWDSITSKPTTFAPSAHTHAWNTITDKPTSFTPSAHTHAWNTITDKPTSFPPSTHTHAWDSITSKPTTFAPSAHTHAWNTITDKPTSFTPSAHTHAWNTITDKPTSFTPSAHTHAWSTITDKPAWLSPTTLATFEAAHGHAWSQITDKPSTFAPSAHSHAQSDVNSSSGWITTALSGKQPTGSYLLTTGTAADSSKLGGILAGNYYHSGNANRSNVDWYCRDSFITGYLKTQIPYVTGDNIPTVKFLSYNDSPWGLVFSIFNNGNYALQSKREVGNEYFNLLFCHEGGNVGIGTTSPTQRLHVSGNILAAGEVTAYSDRRLKSNITPLESALDKLLLINPVRYIKDDKPSIGVIAQELQELYPELVTDGEYLSVNYAQLTAVIIKAIQELKDKIDGTTK